MQNKGFVRVFAILLTLVCVFYLSFSFVTRHYTSKAKEFAKGDVKVEQDYLDSLANEKVYFGNWTLKQCREMEISLGLDLKGGMNVILEVSVPDVIKALADNKSDEAFNQALATAAKQATTAISGPMFWTTMPSKLSRNTVSSTSRQPTSSARMFWKKETAKTR